MVTKSQVQQWLLGAVTLLGGAILQLFVLKNVMHAVLGRDLVLYVYQSWQLLDGVLPSGIQKPIGHAIWLAVYQVLTGDVGGHYYVVYSCVAVGVIPFIVFLLFRNHFGVKYGVVAAIGYIASPAFFLHSALAETPGLFLSLLATLLVTIRGKNLAWLWSFIAGCMTFWAYLCRPELLMSAILCFALLMSSLAPIRIRLLRVIAYIVPLGVLIVLLMVFNRSWYGEVAPVRYYAQSMYCVTFQNYNFKHYSYDCGLPQVSRVADAMQRAELVDPSQSNVCDIVESGHAWLVARVALQRINGSWAAADRAMIGAVLAVWMQDRWTCVVNMSHTFMRFAFLSEKAASSIGITDGVGRTTRVGGKSYFAEKNLALSQEMLQAGGFNGQDARFEAARRFYNTVRDSRRSVAQWAWKGWRPSEVCRTWWEGSLIASILVYIGIVLAICKLRGRELVVAASLVAFSICMWCAYALVGWVQDRHVAMSSWPMFIAASLGYWNALSEVNILFKAAHAKGGRNRGERP